MPYLNIADRKIFFKLKRNRLSRRLKIIISQEAEVTVVAPTRLSEKAIFDFVEKNSSFVAEKISLIERNAIPAEMSEFGQTNFDACKFRAKKIIDKKLLAVNDVYNFKYKQVSVKNAKSRWGSCSSDGNLCFNYRILFLPDELAEYIVAHELCHLKEMNHSRNFWNLVAVASPDYKKCRETLKRITFKRLNSERTM
ncbi:MAG TPA: M48 family metallopeptidase [Candidatus Bipolaricaulota bacterium]|nr:M48 family metallopeptidase [Candidatus Bipolaricaulota bacterium]